METNLEQSPPFMTLMLLLYEEQSQLSSEYMIIC